MAISLTHSLCRLDGKGEWLYSAGPHAAGLVDIYLESYEHSGGSMPGGPDQSCTLNGP